MSRPAHNKAEAAATEAALSSLVQRSNRMQWSKLPVFESVVKDTNIYLDINDPSIVMKPKSFRVGNFRIRNT